MQPNCNSMKRTIFLLLFSFCAFAQGNSRIEDSTHIYWQPDILFTKSDFKFDGNLEPNAKMYCDKVQLCTSAATNFNVIIDVPINSKKKNTLERIYLVPVFDKQRSYMFGNDSIGMLLQKVVFDIEEYAVRYARQQLATTLAQFKQKQGSIIIWHASVLDNAKIKRQKLVAEFTKDIYLDPKANAYELWRTKTNALLDELKLYATQPKDCARFKNKKPDAGFTQLFFLGEEQ